MNEVKRGDKAKDERRVVEMGRASLNDEGLGAKIQLEDISRLDVFNMLGSVDFSSFL